MTMKKTATRVAAKTLGVIGTVMTGGAAGAAVGASTAKKAPETMKLMNGEYTSLGGNVVKDRAYTSVSSDPAGDLASAVEGAAHGLPYGVAAGLASVAVPLAVRGYRASRRVHLADGAAKARK